jgi:hypothetical protein
MQLHLIMILLFSTFQSNLLFDFTKSSTVEAWIIVNDVVMGGNLRALSKLNEEGHGVFEGRIS